MTDHSPAIRRALISVSDKSGLVEFASFLAGHGVEILSTGGTAKAMRDAGLDVKDVAEHTGFPEMMDGRVKTLHPTVHGGILARRSDPGHLAAMEEHDIAPIDLIVVNLYPFEATVAAGADYETCVENIDIGGPAMIRSAAKNHESVTIVTDAEDYAAVMEDMKANGGATGPELRRRLAGTAYARTAAYDVARTTIRFRAVSPCRGPARKACAMAKTHIRMRRFMSPGTSGPALPRRRRSRARS
jgi:phosphoribosylaminoimidazolecarboxamide formyltransferase / IMP cyclohydrolase